MERFDYLIVGGGLAASAAVDGIRERDADGSIALLGEESEPPYHRPPLSKEYMRSPEAPRELLHVKPEGWFEEEARVDLRAETKVAALDPRERTVTTDEGEEFRGERLLLATGGRCRVLELKGGELDNVFTLRTVDDAEAIRKAAGEAESALLVGAGFIGMELAASFCQMGVRPVVVEALDRVWPVVLPPELSEFVRAHFEDRGVEFRLGTTVRELGGETRVERATLEDGERLPCDLVVVGVGIEPRSELAVEAGLAVSDGIVVDRYGETSHGYIYAAGDVARFPDPVFEDFCRVEHWDHAKAHGKLVGRNMAGDGSSYDHVSYFFSDVFDLSLNVVGRPAGADRVILREPLDPERTVAFTLAEGRLCGAVTVNAPDALEDCRALVRRRPTLEELEEELGDSGVELDEVVT